MSPRIAFSDQVFVGQPPYRLPVSYYLYGVTDEGHEIYFDKAIEAGGVDPVRDEDGDFPTGSNFLGHPHASKSTNVTVGSIYVDGENPGFKLLRIYRNTMDDPTYSGLVSQAAYGTPQIPAYNGDFRDFILNEDLSFNPPTQGNADLNKVGRVVYFQQRSFLIQEDSEDDIVYASKLGTVDFFKYPINLRPTEAFEFNLPLKRGGRILHILDLQRLIFFTNYEIFIVSGSGDRGFISPTELNPNYLSEEGVAEDIAPRKLGQTGYFINRNKTKLIQLSVSSTGEVGIRNFGITGEHFFDNEIIGLEVTKQSFGDVVYLLRRDGKIVSATIEGDSAGYSLIETQGRVESITKVENDPFYRPQSSWLGSSVNRSASEATRFVIDKIQNLPNRRIPYFGGEREESIAVTVIRDGRRYLEELVTRDDVNDPGAIYCDSAVTFGTRLFKDQMGSWQRFSASEDRIVKVINMAETFSTNDLVTTSIRGIRTQSDLKFSKGDNLLGTNSYLFIADSGGLADSRARGLRMLREISVASEFEFDVLKSLDSGTYTSGRTATYTRYIVKPVSVMQAENINTYSNFLGQADSGTSVKTSYTGTDTMAVRCLILSEDDVSATIAPNTWMRDMDNFKITYNDYLDNQTFTIVTERVTDDGMGAIFTSTEITPPKAPRPESLDRLQLGSSFNSAGTSTLNEAGQRLANRVSVVGRNLFPEITVPYSLEDIIARSDAPFVDFYYGDEEGDMQTARFIITERVVGTATVTPKVFGYFDFDLPEHILEDTTYRFKTTPTASVETRTGKTLVSSRYAIPVNRVEGLTHLRGKKVSVFADGRVISSPNNPELPTLTVDMDGNLDLGGYYGYGVVGLPYTFEMETLPIEAGDNRTFADSHKVISQVGVVLYRTRGLQMQTTKYATEGPSKATDFPLRRDKRLEKSGTSFSGNLLGSVRGGWGPEGTVTIRQVDPLPITVFSIYPKGEIGE